MKPYQKKEGYLVVGISVEGVRKHHYIHRLVLSAFVKNETEAPQVNDINGIKTDNNLGNLEWVTRSQNQKHAFAIGLKKGRSFYSQEFIQTLLEKYLSDKSNTLIKISREFGPSPTSIRRWLTQAGESGN